LIGETCLMRDGHYMQFQSFCNEHDTEENEQWSKQTKTNARHTSSKQTEEHGKTGPQVGCRGINIQELQVTDTMSNFGIVGTLYITTFKPNIVMSHNNTHLQKYYTFYQCMYHFGIISIRHSPIVHPCIHEAMTLSRFQN